MISRQTFFNVVLLVKGCGVDADKAFEVGDKICELIEKETLATNENVKQAVNATKQVPAVPVKINKFGVPVPPINYKFQTDTLNKVNPS